MSQKWRKEEGEQKRRERFVFMLVVTGVFIAPPTQGERKQEMGEGGCIIEKERDRGRRDIIRKRVRRRQKERLEEQQEGDITEGMFY